ncbi:MAG TPA: prenyltransferase/squalene oxidase repeat-containing protein [Thermoleophilaceae bacterium]
MGYPGNRTAVGRAARWLLARQHPDGSFGPGAVGDAATTGTAIVVFKRTGAARAAISRAVHWLRAAQLPDGGFGTRATHARPWLTALAARQLSGGQTP